MSYSSYSTTRNYNEDGSGTVEYNAYNGENFLNSGEIPQPKYIGGIGDGCNTGSQCHENLYCYSGVCSNWNPIGNPFKDQSVYIRRSPYSEVRMCTYREDCPGEWVCVNHTCQLPVIESKESKESKEPKREGFKSQSQPISSSQPLSSSQQPVTSNTNRQNVQPMYTSKYKANSGRNYYLYDETK